MFDAIVGFLSVVMVLFILVAIVDCAVKMWPVKLFVDERAARQRVFEELQFQVAQSEATVAERDKTLSFLLGENQDLRVQIEDHKEEIQRLEYLVDLEEQLVAERNKTIDGLIVQVEGLKEKYRVHRMELWSRYDKISKLLARNKELNAQVEGLKYSIKTRGGQVPDLNAAWHMTDKPLDVKQKYLLDDTPLDDSGSGVIDSHPYGE